MLYQNLITHSCIMLLSLRPILLCICHNITSFSFTSMKHVLTPFCKIISFYNKNFWQTSISVCSAYTCSICYIDWYCGLVNCDIEQLPFMLRTILVSVIFLIENLQISLGWHIRTQRKLMCIKVSYLVML